MPTAVKETYIETVGRRKTASARARVFADDKQKKVHITINDKPVEKFFSIDELQRAVFEPLEKLKKTSGYRITIKVQGGGIRGQAEAIRHAIARALVKEDESIRKKLKRPGFLKRDPRVKERRKFGLKKARKAPQWSKR
ncbi:MAG: 30S ribosomal protein S9 [Candidatus Niyogibacteria bacterium CG10_big_fil_rev_8_21_14_0_10_46_36]|uniref:Small ribosomal subunit protein uS9 n=1 Tax=Candidatus Niyogibacteria bacterium CG10_big_fil_rev_8_21_14_0_10_46_36 TaxID=1974726 RepID=A0A2H0TGF0_9BACT|nr:MAG: 30S ribosomal protein S9 [Candidatus Niyogibacteria bacterium CG10_big_fil_rev_8_21_14_0_10_46_36]